MDTEGKKKIYAHTIPDEADLLQKMAHDNMSAFNILYSNFQPKLYQYIIPFTQNSSIDANDIVQDIFTKLWVKRKALAGILSLEYYLYRMARNRLIDLKRSSDIQQTHHLQYGSSQSAQAETTLFDMQYREFEKRAQEAIQKLPYRRREIFDLSINKDLSLAEIAEYLQLSTSVVKKQLYLASQFVKDAISHSKILQMLASLIVFSKFIFQ